MNGRRLMAALCAIAAVVILGVQVYFGNKTVSATEQVARAIEAQASAQPQGPTSVYTQSIQNTQAPGDVSFYDVPSPGSATDRTLPAFTRVEMLCWVNTGEERWFYVRVMGQNPAVQVGQIVVVRATDTHQQIIVDGCQKR